MALGGERLGGRREYALPRSYRALLLQLPAPRRELGTEGFTGYSPCDPFALF